MFTPDNGRLFIPRCFYCELALDAATALIDYRNGLLMCPACAAYNREHGYS